MRILHLIPTLQGGGAERQLALLAREQAANGIAVAVAYHTEGPNLKYLENSNVVLLPMSLSGHYDPAALWLIIGYIRDWRPDIVQTWLSPMDIVGGIAAKLTGLPHVICERSSGSAYERGWKSHIRAVIGRRARAIIANSPAGLNYWRKIGAYGSLNLIRNGITQFEPATNNLTNLRKPAILYVGRLEEVKNLENMIAGFIRVLESREDVSAYIVGAGPLEPELRKWVANSGITDRIHLVGYVDNLYTWYQNADVLVSLSHYEGHPNVVLEAAYMGCPLVLSDIPEHRDTIPSDGALFVDRLSALGIASAINKALTDTVGNSLRTSASLNIVGQLTVQKQTKKYKIVYENILKT